MLPSTSHAHRRSETPLIRSGIAWAVLALAGVGCSAQLSPAAGADARDAAVTVVDDEPDFQPVTAWLVAGPFPSTDRLWRGERWPARKGFDTDFLESIGGEANARPSRGALVQDPDGNDVPFLYRNWRDAYIDLTDVYGRIGHVAAYIYAELESSEEREVYLHIGSNDAAKLWVGGELVLSQPEDRSAWPSQNVVRAHLAAGRTPVLMKIDQAGNNWGAFVEIANTSYRRPCDRGRSNRRTGWEGFPFSSDSTMPYPGYGR